MGDDGSIQDHLLGKLRLSVGEAARVTGVSVRQLSYWTQKGLVRALGTPNKKRYDVRSLERIVLIKRHVSDGYQLDEAARLADSWQRAARAAKLALVQEPHEVIAQRVAELEELVSYLKRRLAQSPSREQLTSTASKLSELNLAALIDEHPPLRRRLRLMRPAAIAAREA